MSSLIKLTKAEEKKINSRFSENALKMMGTRAAKLGTLLQAGEPK